MPRYNYAGGRMRDETPSRHQERESRVPTAETRQAMQRVRDRENLVSYASIAECFEEKKI